jgi:ERCC4-type nuclease
MIILVDSQEKLPLEFSHPYVEGSQRISRDVGDYCARYKDAHQPPIFFERKSLPDLFGTMGKGYKRFRKEIMRSKDNKSELIIIIEGTVTDILRGTVYSQIDGLKILRTILSVWDKYKVVSVFCRDRKEMATFIAEYYCAYARNRLKGKNDIRSEGK